MDKLVDCSYSCQLFCPSYGCDLPQAFLIECVNTLYRGVGDVEAGYYEPVVKLKDCI